MTLRTLETLIDGVFALLHEHQVLLSPEALADQLADIDRFLDCIETGDRQAVWHILARCMSRVGAALERQQHPALEACRRREASLHFLAGS